MERSISIDFASLVHSIINRKEHSAFSIHRPFYTFHLSTKEVHKEKSTEDTELTPSYHSFPITCCHPERSEESFIKYKVAY